MSNPKIFLICPVRGITDEEMNFLDDYVANMESIGIYVHYPRTDTNQDDDIGLNICTQNREAIKDGDQVRLFYNPSSQGSFFDLGMTFMAEKPLIVVNDESLISSAKKEFSTLASIDEMTSFILNYAQNLNNQPINYHNLDQRKKEILNSSSIEYEWNGGSPNFYFDFGMSFMAEIPIYLSNRNQVERTEHKSFQNVLLALDERYKAMN